MTTYEYRGHKVFQAKFNGWCASCARPISPGEWIFSVKPHGAYHKTCGPSHNPSAQIPDVLKGVTRQPGGAR